MSVSLQIDGAVAVITLDRRDCRNAINPQTAQQLREKFAQFAQNDHLKVAVLYGAGGHFCSGYDLTELSTAGLSSSSAALDSFGPGPMGPTRTLLEKPVIGAIEGYAVAGGLELAIWCDLRVGDPTSIFGVFCRRFGVPLIDGGTIRLPRLIGMSRAMDMILTGRPVAAEEALHFGLLNRLVDPGQTLPEAIKLAQEISQFPQLCMKADRHSAYLQWGLEWHDALQNEAKGGEKVVLEEALPGAKRFKEGAGRHGDFDRT